MMNNTKRPLEHKDTSPSKRVKFEFAARSNRGRGSSPRRGSFQHRGSSFKRGSFQGRPFGRGARQFLRGKNFHNEKTFGHGRYFINNSFTGQDNSKQDKPAVKNNGLRISFPDLQKSYKPVLKKILEKCEEVISPRTIESLWTPEELIKNLPTLKDMLIGNETIQFTISTPLESKNKKFLLTFASSEAASEAARKVMSTKSSVIYLKPYYEDNIFYSHCNTKLPVNFQKVEKNLRILNEELETKNGTNEEESETEEEENEDDDDDDVEEEAEIYKVESDVGEEGKSDEEEEAEIYKVESNVGEEGVSDEEEEAEIYKVESDVGEEGESDEEEEAEIYKVESDVGEEGESDEGEEAEIYKVESNVGEEGVSDEEEEAEIYKVESDVGEEGESDEEEDSEFFDDDD